MIYIDNLKIELLMPEVLMDYLKNKNIIEAFIIKDGDYYLRKVISKEDKNTVLDACLYFIFNDVAQTIMTDEDLMNSFSSISKTINYTDSRAKFLRARGKIDIANKILKEKINEIYKFKLELITKEEHKINL